MQCTQSSRNLLDELKSPSEVQDQVSRHQLAGVRPGSHSTRQHHGVVLARSDQNLEREAFGQEGSTAHVLGSRNRNRSHAAPRVPLAAASNGRLLELALRDDGPRLVRTGSHDVIGA